MCTCNVVLFLTVTVICIVLIADFSLERWKAHNNIPDNTQLSPTMFAMLADDLGISQYLQDIECALSSSRPKNGWKNSKTYFVILYIAYILIKYSNTTRVY